MILSLKFIFNTLSMCCLQIMIWSSTFLPVQMRWGWCHDYSCLVWWSWFFVWSFWLIFPFIPSIIFPSIGLMGFTVYNCYDCVYLILFSGCQLSIMLGGYPWSSSSLLLVVWFVLYYYYNVHFWIGDNRIFLWNNWLYPYWLLTWFSFCGDGSFFYDPIQMIIYDLYQCIFCILVGNS